MHARHLAVVVLFIATSIGVLCSIPSPSPGTIKPRSSAGIRTRFPEASPPTWRVSSSDPVLLAEIRVRPEHLSEHRAPVVPSLPTTPPHSVPSTTASSTASTAAPVTPHPPVPVTPVATEPVVTTPPAPPSARTVAASATPVAPASDETWQQATLALPWDGALMIRVAFCESTDNPTAVNGSSYGLFQVQGETSADPLTQVADAFHLWTVQGIGAWVSSERCWG